MVEVICALALFAIVAVFILNTLLVGAKLLSSAKNKTKDSMKAGGVVAQAAASSSVSAPDGTTVTTSSGSFSVTFNTGSSSVTVNVPGRFITGTASGANPGESVNFSTFDAN